MPMTRKEWLGETYRAEGAGGALAMYDQLRDQFYGHEVYDFGESVLNVIGYQVMATGGLDGAVLVFQKNVELFPNASNVYDSLGEAYMERGDKELAIDNYERSLELDSDNQNAVQMLQELRAGG